MHTPTPQPSFRTRPFVRFLAVGPIGLSLGAAQYELLWMLNPIDAFRAGSTWVVSSVIGVAWVHALHCHFTFAGTARGRWRATLGRAYVLYAACIVLGMLLMHLLVDELGWFRTSSWMATTAITSLFNFTLLRRLVGLACPPSGTLTRVRGIARRDVTVIAPARNERDNVAPFLASLPADVQLIVVDASDDDTTARILALRPHRTHVERFPGNIPVARQRGAQLATSPWLLFTDVDVVFDPSYFERLRDCEVPVDCAGIVATKRTRDRFRMYYALFTLGQRLCAWAGIPAATGSNMLMRRDALLACGGFDASLSVNEDSEAMWRCQRAGYRVKFAGELAVFARDHRRLERGVLRKFVHSIVRCVGLYLDILPAQWKAADWGYWKSQPTPVIAPEQR
ncbi:MAG: glycosyltransferase [Gemmatimonadaceae bacterium]|jgi:putative flippase GtrA